VHVPPKLDQSPVGVKADGEKKHGRRRSWLIFGENVMSSSIVMRAESVVMCLVSGSVREGGFL
jgi:hypothetical protein